jgi:hypothetical protein
MKINLVDLTFYGIVHRNKSDQKVRYSTLYSQRTEYCQHTSYTSCYDSVEKIFYPGVAALLLIQASKNEVRYQSDHCRYSLGYACVCVFYVSLLPGMAYGMGSYHGKDQSHIPMSLTSPPPPFFLL